MRILYIASSCGWGGGNVALYNLIKGLKDNGHEILVLFPNEKNKRFCEELDAIGIHYLFDSYGLTIYPLTKNPFKFFIRLIKKVIITNAVKKRIYTLIRSYRPDIVHTNVGPLDIALSACLKCHIPHVWHLREYQDLDFKMTSIPSKSSFIKRIHKQGNYNIAITDGVFLYWNLDPLKDVVIYDGVFSESFQTTDVKKENIILFVGRVEQAKGLLEVIAPFAKFAKLHPDYKLIIAGRYLEKSKYYQRCMNMICDLALNDRVSFLGEVNNVYEWMSRAKALVVPSRFEGFGFITAEAMLNKCYVIGRNTAGTKDQFDKCFEITGEECGFRFIDECGLLKGLLYSVENDTSHKCKLAQMVVRNNYTLERHCKRVEEYYQKIVGCSGLKKGQDSMVFL